MRGPYSGSLHGVGPVFEVQCEQALKGLGILFG